MSENTFMDDAADALHVDGKTLDAHQDTACGVNSCNCSKLHPGFKLGLVLVAVSLSAVNLTAVAYPNLAAAIGEALPDALMFSDQSHVVGHNRGSCPCHEADAVTVGRPREMKDDDVTYASGVTAVDEQGLAQPSH